MSRDVTHEQDGPYVIDEDELADEGGTVAVCQCGLSANKPHCDGSHAVADDEAAGVTYRYEDDDDEGERTVVDDGDGERSVADDD